MKTRNGNTNKYFDHFSNIFRFWNILFWPFFKYNFCYRFVIILILSFFAIIFPLLIFLRTWHIHETRASGRGEQARFFFVIAARGFLLHDPGTTLCKLRCKHRDEVFLDQQGRCRHCILGLMYSASVPKFGAVLGGLRVKFLDSGLK
jgi:hypothetical protein